jgi:hypothetical protein
VFEVSDEDALSGEAAAELAPEVALHRERQLCVDEELKVGDLDPMLKTFFLRQRRFGKRGRAFDPNLV